MKLTRCATALLATRLALVQGKGALFKNNVNVPITDCVGNNGNGNGPNIHSANALSNKCDKDVQSIERRNAGHGQQSRVKNVDKVSLQCSELDPEMNTVSFELNKVTFTAQMQAYNYDTVLQRNVWLGKLDKYDGYINVVWDQSCNRESFMFEVTLPTDSSGRNVIQSIPCSLDDGSDTTDCTWLAHVNMDAIQEGESFTPNRRELEVGMSSAQQHETVEKDADIELLRQLLEGDGDAADRFTQGGGRKLTHHDPETGNKRHEYVMPSGRRLDDGSIIRVLWVYTAAAAKAAGGETALKSKIAAGLTTSNTAFLQSGISLVYQVAAVLPVVYTDVSHSQSLSDLQSGKIPNVLQWRNDYAADVVQMFINPSEWCGLGYYMNVGSSGFAPSAFSTVYWDCISYYSSPHEIGHNMGMDHDLADAGGSGHNPYAYGYWYCSTPNKRTIMAYGCTTGTATRMPQFSSPLVKFTGTTYATGTSTADNARVARDNKLIVSNFRTGTGTGASPTPAPTAKPTTKAPTAVTTPHSLVIKTSTTSIADSYLNLADVKIIGASNVVATLSDTLSTYYASNCIDTGSTYLSTFCHSGGVGGSLTLTYTGAATSVVVTNRQDCCQYRINSASMTLDGKLVYTFPTVTAASYTITLPAADMMPTELTMPAELTVPSGFTPLGGLIQSSSYVQAYPDGTVTTTADGSRVVVKLDVATASYYPVSYMLSTVANVDTVLMGIKKGYVSCGKGSVTSSTGGRISLKNVSTQGVLTKYASSNSLYLDAGVNQYYTLCFEQGAYVNVASVCVGYYC